TGVTILSGQGTSSITVNFSTTLGNNSSCGSPAICVRSGNSCGWSSYYCQDVQLAPSTPGSISGSSTPCRNQPNVYSISAVAGATSYQWTVPSGYTIQSGQGTTSISVLPGSNSGSIGVRAVNACGMSSLRSKSVSPKTCTRSMPMDMEIWPNPAMNIVFFGYDEIVPESLDIYDMMGKIIYSGTWLQEFDVSSLAGGVYFVRASNEGESIVKRLEVVK
ncbi:MAG: T9SS type A sorting domain-containing protein, partial [Flavobacteriales bacterium]